MKFVSFKNNISKLKNSSLGGLDVQFQLAPKIRLRISENKIKKLSPKAAAVMALFYPNEKGETCLLLTLRAQYNGTHSSQISFPGGKQDNKDTNLQNTALRESFEEVGIFTNSVTIFKQMTEVYIPPSNFLVTPFLGYINKTPIFTKNHEVQELISVKVSDILNKSSISTTILSTSYATNMEVPCFLLNGYIVWGATAMMLNEIKELLKIL